jgi:glycosyltransferase involved in cell wall biosynthesis
VSILGCNLQLDIPAHLPSATNDAVLRPCDLATLPEEPLVSILLASYNYAQYIGQSIESVRNQTYDNWELIICDDGSTDNSIDVIKRYSSHEPRISVIQKANGGHASALNAAFAHSRGEIVCLLDADDIYLPNKVASIVESCIANATAGLIIHRIIRVDPDRKQLGVWPLSDVADGWLGPELLKAGGILGYAPPTAGINLRRELAERLFPLTTKGPLHMCPDQVIMRLAPLATVVKRVPKALAEYRLHTSNTYSRKTTSGESVARELVLSQALWLEQRRYLTDIDPDLAQQLTSLDGDSYIALLEYIRAKLMDRADTIERHKHYLRTCDHEGNKKFYYFWRASVYLPKLVFGSAVNLLFGQGAIKQFLWRLKKLI